MTLTLESIDPHISPVIDLERMSAIFVSNRVDNPVKDYKTDGRVTGNHLIFLMLRDFVMCTLECPWTLLSFRRERHRGSDTRLSFPLCLSPTKSCDAM